MFMKKFIQLFLLLVGLGLTTACGAEVSVSRATISQAQLAKDSLAAQPTTQFGLNDTFYLVVDLANAPEDTQVKAVWKAVQAEGADPNTILKEFELTSGTGQLHFDLKNDYPWPVGSYEVALFLNGQAAQTLAFQVVAPAGSASEPQATTAAAEPLATATLSSGGAVNNLEMVKTAAIQIEAQGTFVDPQVGTMYNAAGRGSGFIIDPSGLAITNNHVVTGAALLKVWVGGEKEPRNARILGVSECADLAVIDIDGDDFPYLSWYDGEVKVGLDVYAAGFPLGDPEYTLTRGIIAKANANGESYWASVDGVIQHDATINPGNSGGALVTAEGQVVAVNYSGALEANQYFSITQQQALPVLERLKAGEDYLSIGVNGRAVNDGAGLSGIWVASVKSGSPADKAGVKAGDIITRLQGLVLATDGTLADYCDILRTHEAGATMSIEVLRFSTQEVWEGQLNGREMELSFSFAQELGEEADQSYVSEPVEQYTNYVTLTDDSGQLSIEVPAEWQEVSGEQWVLDDTPIGFAITASPNIYYFLNSWSTPGVFFGASDQITASLGEMLDAYSGQQYCTYEGRTEYADQLYSGVYDVWSECGNLSTLYVVLAVEPADFRYKLLIAVQAASAADLEALDHILRTFKVVQ